MMNNEEQFEQLKDQNRQLLARIARLQKRIDTLENGMTRLVKSDRNYDAEIFRHMEMARTDIWDAVDRIINLEHSVFPHLAADIKKLNGIIGDGDGNYKAQHKLDRRKP